MMMVVFLTTLACGGARADPANSPEEWIQLFNGRDLDGWTPKITGFDLGEDPWRTFRVVDGLLTVAYESYEAFDNRFGHLFYAEPYSSYHLRVQYRFVGTQVPGGPAWAERNSGVMFHSQTPESVLRDQDFPVSLELQFLGGNGTDSRPTANLCTPGTHVHMNGALVERHCVAATAPTFHGEHWVTAELIVRGGTSIRHVVQGDTVLAYDEPVVGGGDVNEFRDPRRPAGSSVDRGYLALQSESHPIQFRRVEIRVLPGDPRR